MKNLIFRLFFIILAGVMLFSYIFPWNSYGIQMPFTGKEYRLGLDLQWWIELDYKIDLTQAEEDEDFDTQSTDNQKIWLEKHMKDSIQEIDNLEKERNKHKIENI